MPAESTCPSCAQPGDLIGHDRKLRAQYACSTDGCDVLEFDRDLILARKGATWSLAQPPPGPRPAGGRRVPDTSASRRALRTPPGGRQGA